MVVGATMTIQQVPSKGRISIMMLQNLTVQRRQPVLKILYGSLMVVISLIMMLIDPIQLVTNWMMEVKQGSFIYKTWEKLPYQLYAEVWVYNYTNVPQYLDGEDDVLKIKEIGPFLYEEYRTNRNITIDRERGVMSMIPNIQLKFAKNQSVADTNDVNITVPNIALLALSTLLADKLGYFANAGAYYSINALGSKLFRNMTVEELLWGYEDPIITISSSLLPGWIDFQKIGILDRFYSQKEETAEIEIADEKTRFSIVNWNDSPGILEQGFTDLNTSIPCNRARGTYEGIMLSSHLKKNGTIPIFRRQGCRIFPFSYRKAVNDVYGFEYYRYMMETSAFNRSSEYACNCKSNCLPDGFVDVSNCYYGFPITLSKPHFMDADPQQQSYYEGMNPDPEKHTSILDVEPTMGIPLALASKMQVNVAVRMSAGNPITKPLKDKVVPVLWLSLYCKQPPPEILNLLSLRLVIAPPLVITIEVFLFVIGFIIGIAGFYRFLRPTYKVVNILENRKISIIERNSIPRETFPSNDDEFLAKEAVSLLTIKEDDYPSIYIDT